MPFQSQQTDSLEEAIQLLTSNGYLYSHKGLDRQYWVNGDKSKPEFFLDHSATLKKVGNTYHVAMFWDERA